MSATPVVSPSIPGSAAPGTAPAGAAVDTAGEPDFAQVLDALLTPAPAVDPALVANAGTGGAAPDTASTVEGNDDQATDGTAEASPQGAPTLQVVPQALVIPTATVVARTEAAGEVSEGTVAMPNPPMFVRGPARAFDAAADEPVQKGIAVDLVPGVPVSPARIAAEATPTGAVDAVATPSTALETAGSPSTISTDTASNTPSGADILGLAPAERAGRESSAAVAADPTRTGVRIDAPDFADEFGNRVVWMAGRNQQVAELRIDPPQLGPVEVRLSLSNDQASLVLLSPHASVRDALQATLPRLHDLLAAAGINLGSVHVGAHGHSGGHTGDQPAPGRHASRDAGLPAMLQASSWVAGGRGMVDVYA